MRAMSGDVTAAAGGYVTLPWYCGARCSCCRRCRCCTCVAACARGVYLFGRVVELVVMVKKGCGLSSKAPLMPGMPGATQNHARPSFIVSLPRASRFLLLCQPASTTAPSSLSSNQRSPILVGLLARSGAREWRGRPLLSCSHSIACWEVPNRTERRAQSSQEITSYYA